MEVDIKITIEVEPEDFNERELRSAILAGFPEKFGYEIKELEIRKEAK